MAKVLVAGLGNIFLGDDGFGVEVVARLRNIPLPDGVVVRDVGIRSLHLAYELADSTWDGLILVDATGRGGPPGTLYVVELDGSGATPGLTDPHGVTPADIFGLLARLGAAPPGRVLLVGCEPGDLTAGSGLSPEVAAAVPRAVEVVCRLVRELGAEAGQCTNLPSP